MGGAIANPDDMMMMMMMMISVSLIMFCHCVFVVSRIYFTCISWLLSGIVLCDCQSYEWMSRVLQAVDSIHQVGIYCLALVPPNCLPKVSHMLHLYEYIFSDYVTFIIIIAILVIL